MSILVRPLLEVLQDVPDHRQASGRRYPLAAVLGLVCAATLCGYRSYGAMAQWGQDYGEEWVRALGFSKGVTPAVGTLHAILTQLEVEALETVLSRWAHAVLETATAASAASSAASAASSADNGAAAAVVIALDGKTLRGAAQQGAAGAHLLAAIAPALGLTLYQRAVPDKTNEIGAVQEVLRGLMLEGRVVTVDALLTQREVAQVIVQKGGTT